MAVKAATVTDLGDAVIVVWETLANGDTGEPIELIGYADRSYDISGTWGASGQCDVEGSNGGSNYFILNDPFGTVASLTGDNGVEITEATRYQRPNASAGDGTTALDVVLFARRTSR
jgi:hypothetical protein